MEELEANEKREASSRALVCRSWVDSLEGRFGSFILGAIVGSTNSIGVRFEVVLEGRSVDTRKIEEERMSTQKRMGRMSTDLWHPPMSTCLMSTCLMSTWAVSTFKESYARERKRIRFVTHLWSLLMSTWSLSTCLMSTCIMSTFMVSYARKHFCFVLLFLSLCSSDPNHFENMKISVCWMAVKKICAIEFWSELKCQVAVRKSLIRLEHKALLAVCDFDNHSF